MFYSGGVGSFSTGFGLCLYELQVDLGSLLFTNRGGRRRGGGYRDARCYGDCERNIITLEDYKGYFPYFQLKVINEIDLTLRLPPVGVSKLLINFLVVGSRMGIIGTLNATSVTKGLGPFLGVTYCEGDRPTSGLTILKVGSGLGGTLIREYKGEHNGLNYTL